MEWLQGIAISAAGSALVAFVGWLIRTWLIAEPSLPASDSRESPTLSELVDLYSRQRSARELAQTGAVIVERRHVVTVDSTTKGGDDELGILIIAFIAVAILSAFWQQYKIQFLIATCVLAVIGWTSSFYFAAVLRRIHGPLRWEDHVLSWGSMLVWSLSIFGFIMGVFAPFYAPELPREGFVLMAAQGLQMLGAASVYVAILLTATVQFFAGSIYRKALLDRAPNRLEAWVWSRRQEAILISAFSLVVGVPLVSGLLTFMFPSYIA